MNKKGVSAEVVVFAVVAVVIGVIIILGATGKINLSSLNPWTSGGSSLATKGQQCKVACSASDKDNWCLKNGESDKIKLTDSQLTETLKLAKDDIAKADELPVTAAGADGAKVKSKAVYNINCEQLVAVKLIQTSCPELIC
ncbi:hypothetical protein FJZ19_05720 [Candidatus Pacearchaeota archaeon]|nr:hypothetical protein [Candidatus Pacearchaeota archaeon]